MTGSSSSALSLARGAPLELDGAASPFTGGTVVAEEEVGTALETEGDLDLFGGKPESAVLCHFSRRSHIERTELRRAFSNVLFSANRRFDSSESTLLTVLVFDGMNLISGLPVGYASGMEMLRALFVFRSPIARMKLPRPAHSRNTNSGNRTRNSSTCFDRTGWSRIEKRWPERGLLTTGAFADEEDADADGSCGRDAVGRRNTAVGSRGSDATCRRGTMTRMAVG